MLAMGISGKSQPQAQLSLGTAVRPFQDSEFELRFLRCCSVDSSKVGHSCPRCRKPAGRAPLGSWGQGAVRDSGP